MTTNVASQEKFRYFLTPALEEKSRKELREDPDRRTQAIDEIRQWLTDHKIIYSRTDEEFILKFLRNCKFDLGKTKKKITKYYNIRHDNPTWAARNQENFDIIIELMHQKQRLGTLMNFAGNYHENIVIVNPGAWDYHKYDMYYIGTAMGQIADILLRDPRSQINGFQVVCDCKDLTFGSVMQITPTMIYKFVTCFQNCMPLRIKGLHLMNGPTFVNKILIIGKMFANRKLKNRLHIHEGADFSLCDVFPAEALPNEYGGSAGPSQKFMNDLYDVMQREKDFLLDDEKYGVGKFPENQSYGSEETDSDSI